MLFTAENYGPQARIGIELGDLVTLFVGPNNTGKTFVSRGIYAIIKSCRRESCDGDRLAALLLNNAVVTPRDLWLVSRDLRGSFSLMLRDDEQRFEVEVRYDRDRGLDVDVSGSLDMLTALYVPAHPIASLGLLQTFAGYAAELRDLMSKLALQLIQVPGEAKKPLEILKGLNSDLLYTFTSSILSVLRPLLEQRQELIKAISIMFSPTLLDLAYALHLAGSRGIDERLRTMFRDLFPLFTYSALGLHHSREAPPEIPPHLLSSGMLQLLPILCLLNLALLQAEQGYRRVLVLIDEPEMNLELQRQMRFAEALLSLAHSLHREGKRISLIIATHSDFIAYSITRWIARNNLRSMARVYEFKHEGIKEREIDEYGEVRLETFSDAVRKLFFEEAL